MVSVRMHVHGKRPVSELAEALTDLEFGPNTTTFVYPAEIFPVRVRTTSHGIAAAAGKIGAFIGTYVLTALLPVIGFGDTSAIVAGVSLAGLLVTVTLLPEPKGISLEELARARR